MVIIVIELGIMSNTFYITVHKLKKIYMIIVVIIW